MRKIKFRAWDKKNKEMSQVVEMIFNQYGGIDVRTSRRMDINEDCLGKDSLMQYTGLHDKNGKEIYESDYLGDWCVFWGSGKYILQHISSGDIIDCDEQNTQNKEITGNRFETPKEHSAMATDL